MRTELTTGVGASESGDRAGRSAANPAYSELVADAEDFAVVSCSPASDVTTVIEGVRTVTGDAELVGTTGKCKFTARGVHTSALQGTRGMTVALVASDEMRFSTALGRNVSADTEAGMAEAGGSTVGADLPPDFPTLGAPAEEALQFEQPILEGDGVVPADQRPGGHHRPRDVKRPPCLDGASIAGMQSGGGEVRQRHDDMRGVHEPSPTVVLIPGSEAPGRSRSRNWSTRSSDCVGRERTNETIMDGCDDMGHDAQTGTETEAIEIAVPDSNQRDASPFVRTAANSRQTRIQVGTRDGVAPP